MQLFHLGTLSMGNPIEWNLPVGVCIFTGQRCLLCQLRYHIEFHRYCARVDALCRIVLVRLQALVCKVIVFVFKLTLGSVEEFQFFLIWNNRSRAEIPGIRRNLLWEFNFGVQYAWTLLNFTLVTAYSVSCPLITPFGKNINSTSRDLTWVKFLLGLVYVLLKHFVDRYNIFFAYAPSRINKKIHVAAINSVMFAFLILQLTLFFFSLLRYGLFGVTIFALVGFCVSLGLLVVQASFRLLRSLAPISYRVSECEQAKKGADVHETKFSTAGDALHAEVACLRVDVGRFAYLFPCL